MKLTFTVRSDKDQSQANIANILTANLNADGQPGRNHPRSWVCDSCLAKTHLIMHPQCYACLKVRIHNENIVYVPMSSLCTFPQSSSLASELYPGLFSTLLYGHDEGEG